MDGFEIWKNAIVAKREKLKKGRKSENLVEMGENVENCGKVWNGVMQIYTVDVE